jgi:predicted NBD/HSP70 family sugar kinase
MLDGDGLVQRGSNAVGMRRYNERLVLSSVRRMGGASKADLARATGLSPQAMLRIVEDLEDSGLLIRAGKRTGGKGQPSTIMQVNADGGYTIGVEIGRDHVSCVMLNFDGQVLTERVDRVTLPELDHAIEMLAAFVNEQRNALDTGQRARFMGVGIAMPWFIGEWRDELGVDPTRMRSWTTGDVQARFAAAIDHPLFFENDGNAGALAELFCGNGQDVDSFLYLHIGAFVGGGLVLGGQVQEGRNGNAAALASMPVPGRDGTDFLLHHASLYRLDHSGDEAGPNFAAWCATAGDALSFAVISANSLLDLDAVILDGALPPAQLEVLRHELAAKIASRAPRDFFQPELRIGRLGERAAAIGAGLLPLHATFNPDLNALLKSREG